MKIKIIILFLILGNSVIAQNKIELYFGVSNQGQFDKLLEDFYYPAHPTAMQDDAHIGKDLRIKYNSTLSYLFRDSLEVRLRLGYATRKNHYEQKFPTTSWVVDDVQNVFEISPSFGFNKNFGRFSFSTGLEIPIYFTNPLNEKIDYKEYSDSINLTYAANSDIVIDGGIIIGLNNYIRIKTSFSKHVFMYSELNFGLLYSKLGGNYKDNDGSSFPTTINSYYEYEKSYSKVYLSPIQVQLGLGYKF